jgi:hypothetical protein
MARTTDYSIISVKEVQGTPKLASFPCGGMPFTAGMSLTLLLHSLSFHDKHLAHPAAGLLFLLQLAAVSSSLYHQ